MRKGIRARALHDSAGRIAALTTSPSEGPQASIGLGPGLVMTEVEVPEEVLDMNRMKTEEQASQALREFRVEVSGEAKLLKRNSRRTK